jgi:endoglucanase
VNNGDPDTSGGEPDANQPPPMNTSDVDVQSTVDAQWGEGSCSTVTVTNTGDSTVTWVISLEIEGTITQAWDANYQAGEGNAVAFTGATWNHTLAPGESAAFGYCADTYVMEAAPSGEAEVSTTTASEWATGYCMDVTVHNSSDAAIIWGFQMPVQGTIYNIWNAMATPKDGEMFFQGVSWNATLGPNATMDFGFCANTD